MDENDKARALEEQTARSRDLRELSYGRGHGDWHDPPAEPADLTQDELGLLSSQVQGRHWNGWRRLTGDEDWVYGERMIQPTEAEPSSGKSHDK
jgi:hypothetical protein